MIFRNTYRNIAYILESRSGNGTRFEIGSYDIGHLYKAVHFFDRGLIKEPFFIQSVFVEALSLEVATPADARSMLQLKRGDNGAV